MKKQKDGRYRAKVKVGVDMDGAAIYKYASGRTKKELDENKEELKRAYVTGVKVERGQLFGAYARSWYELCKRDDLSESSRSSYAQMFNNHLLPVFADKQLRAITANELQEFMKDQKRYCASTIGYLYSILNAVFQRAYAHGVIDRDPTVGLVKPSKGKNSRRELTDEETAAVLKVSESHPDRIILLLLYNTGMRLGEMIGLQWQDVDFKSKHIHIRRDFDFKTCAIGEVKSLCSLRDIPMPDTLALSLEPLRGVGTAYVVPGVKKDYLSSGSFTRKWKTLMRAIVEIDKTIENEDGVSILTAHYFRHNYASILYNAGVDVLSAARFLGHADVKTTLQIYDHLSKKREDASASLTRDLLDGKPNDAAPASATIIQP